jgi:hypothetical protein
VKPPEHLSCVLSHDVVWGKAKRFTMRVTPDEEFTARFIVPNVKDHGLFKVNAPSLGVVAPGDVVAVCQAYSTLGPPESESVVVGPRAPIVVNVEYSGDVPEGFTKGQKFNLCVVAQGPRFTPKLRRVK